nr:hypothetical protein BYUHJPPR_BYUHJPPR_CDS_0009 [Microvirus sp.]
MILSLVIILSLVFPRELILSLERCSTSLSLGRKE